MLIHPNINPVALMLGPIKIYWYGVMYVLAFASAWLLATVRARKPNSGWTTQEISDLIFYCALGVIIGGRLGYMFFYDLPNFMGHPLILFKIWQGGMSFHGGLIGVMVSLGLFAHKKHLPFFSLTDFVTPLAPLGLGAGRIGNFINNELWGRVTHVPWAMIYPKVDALARHPSELYEFFMEGVVLFIILWWFSAKPRPRGAVSGLFLLCYGSFRFGLEFFRQPDPQLGFIAFNWITMGQLLSIPMIIGGIMLLFSAFYFDEVKNDNS
ncbi:MAG: prolipoprotein diacylglyceryl transferase [Gammaproteobacteria bacterium]|nr:prolipoprotein diacylglyceryl transferase [Gammaproteobacteria bacterium]